MFYIESNPELLKNFLENLINMTLSLKLFDFVLLVILIVCNNCFIDPAVHIQCHILMTIRVI